MNFNSLDVMKPSSAKAPVSVAAFGELLIDFSPERVTPDGYPVIAAHPGGAPANYIAALAAFGAKTALLAKVGNDAFGKLLINTIAEKGIDTQGVVVSDDVFTTLAFVTLDESGDREFSFARKPGADMSITAAEINTEVINTADCFHFGTLSLTDSPSREATVFAVNYAKQHNKLISFDPNLRRPLWKNLAEARQQILWGLEQADVLKISDEEVEFLFGNLPLEDAAQRLMAEFDIRLVFITCGKDGCVFSTGHYFGAVPGIAGIKAVDTTGAGDIFGGSAMWKLLSTGKAIDRLTYEDLYTIAKFACTSASLSTQTHGGISSVPSLAQVMNFLNHE